MRKMAWIAFCFLSSIGVSAAQTPADDPVGPPFEQRSTGLLNQNNLTATGQTVPHPGVSQGAGQTELDRVIQKRDDWLERRICSNC